MSSTDASPFLQSLSFHLLFQFVNSTDSNHGVLGFWGFGVISKGEEHLVCHFWVTFGVISKGEKHVWGHCWQQVQRIISKCEQRVFGTISADPADPPDLPGSPRIADARPRFGPGEPRARFPDDTRSQRQTLSNNKQCL